MTNKDVLTLINELSASPLVHEYTAVAMGECFIGVDAEMKPALVVRAKSKRPAVTQRTDLVSLQLGVECRLHQADAEPVDGRFHILKCESKDTSTIETFAIIVNAIIQNTGPELGTDEGLARLFHRLAGLFKTTPALNLDRERQGLWGELYIMLRLGVDKWVKHWHSDPAMRYDFACSKKRIEVKTTIMGERIHEFSHQQLMPSGNEEVVVASMMLRPDDAGTDLRAMIQSARTVLASSPDGLAKLEMAVRRAGMESQPVQAVAYDEAFAEERLAWFDIKEVPRFSQQEPPGVSNTRYRVDLSSAPQIESGMLANWLGTWEGSDPN